MAFVFDLFVVVLVISKKNSINEIFLSTTRIFRLYIRHFPCVFLQTCWKSRYTLRTLF